MSAKTHWAFTVAPQLLVATRDIEECDIDRCIDKLSETGETFERLDHGGFHVKDCNNGDKQIRFSAHKKLDGEYTTILGFQGGHRQPSVPWTVQEAKKLANIIMETLELTPKAGLGGSSE